MEADLSSKKFIEHISKVKVKQWEVREACAAGDNMAGSVKVVDIQLDSPTSSNSQGSNTLSLIFKQIPDPSPEWIIAYRVYRTEHALYRGVVPAIEKFASAHDLRYKAPVPKYFCGMNDDKRDYLVLGNLCPEGYVVPKKSQSLEFEEAALVIQELAKFHALSYALLRHEGEQILSTDEDFKWVLDPRKFSENEGSNGFDDLIQAYFKESMELLKECGHPIVKRLENAGIVDKAWKIRRDWAYSRHYFRTIIHFDVWINNILIKYDQFTKQSVDVKLIDFQFLQVGHVFSELQYFIFTSTDYRFRKTHLPELLGKYYDVFAETVKLVKCPVPLGFSKGYFLDEFKKAYLPGFIHMTFAYPLQLGDLAGTVKKLKEEGDTTNAIDKISEIKNFYLKSPYSLERLQELASELNELDIF